LHRQPHVVVADGYLVTFIPEGPLLFTYHRDRPGMIGQVGMLLGSADVNISSMDVGRLGPRQMAMMVLRLDDPVPTEVLKTINTEADIEAAYTLVL
jgi:D-3-phosphoglycerate dehydrogenase